MSTWGSSRTIKIEVRNWKCDVCDYREEVDEGCELPKGWVEVTVPIYLDVCERCVHTYSYLRNLLDGKAFEGEGR